MGITLVCRQCRCLSEFLDGNGCTVCYGNASPECKAGVHSSRLASGRLFGCEIPSHHDTELTVIVNSAGDKKPAMKILVNQPGILLQLTDRLH